MFPKQKQKQELMEKEMVYGSKPATTPKKKRYQQPINSSVYHYQSQFNKALNLINQLKHIQY